TGTGPDAAPVIERVRAHLADDLDTPKALAAIDGWVADVELGLGSDSSGAADVVAAVDALLGVDLR
ncbi:MAG TPA: cysteine--1-D-myo-inosityl 2-amino-2-deoxy-alpha-D-glucopyranoside ligase, partial [Gordonia sp. (in: high G+C Gram-positive bacteria)]|nr:cysteine--1-D-myo-inosityl 2-amino-2-deoxy-alpha-D-glucopyranoside ligase [Gordonia sp. (in: high G+C Gram-positive bacteria)]